MFLFTLASSCKVVACHRWPVDKKHEDAGFARMTPRRSSDLDWDEVVLAQNA